MTILHDIRPGDVIEHRGEVVTVQEAHTYPTPWLLAGSVSLRYRYTSNPRGIDWSGFVSCDEETPRLLSRGVARVDLNIRSLLPG